LGTPLAPQLLKLLGNWIGILNAMYCGMNDKQRLALIVKFLETANKHIKTFHIPNHANLNYFSYMNCGVTKFFAHAEKFDNAAINDAIDCIESDNWDHSEFIMACEGLGQ
jgi:hypothetical protein